MTTDDFESAYEPDDVTATMATDDFGSESAYEPDDVTATMATDDFGSESAYEPDDVTATMATDDFGSESAYEPDDVTATMATDNFGSESTYEPEDVTATMATEDYSSESGYEPDDDNTTAQPTENDYTIDYDSLNSTSGDGSDETEDIVGLIDDEDYADEMGGAAGGAVYKRRRKREVSGRSHHNKNHSKEKDINAVQSEKNFEAMKESRNFQNQVHQILNNEETFREKLDDAMELYKANALNRDKVYSVSSKPKPKLPDSMHRSILTQTSEDVRDVFGNPIRFEYHDSFDPYEQVPKSK